MKENIIYDSIIIPTAKIMANTIPIIATADNPLFDLLLILLFFTSLISHFNLRYSILLLWNIIKISNLSEYIRGLNE